MGAEADRLAQARAQQAVDLEGDFAALTCAIVIDILNVTTDHAGHQLVVAQGTHVFKGAHIAAILEDRDRIADAKHLFHAMGDVKQHFALVTQARDDRHQAVDLPGRKAAGGLVKGNDVGTTRQRLGDFHQLPLAQRQTAELLLRVDLVGQALEAGQRLGAQATAVDHTEARRQMPKEEVFGNGHFRYQVQFLVDHRHAAGDAVGGRLEGHGLAADLYCPAARNISATKDFQ